MIAEQKIIIVGAGISGIAAASKLIQNGFQNVSILEAKNRIGGRIHTADFADNVVDLGAQWVHGEEDNIVFEMASKHNLIEHSSSVSYNFFTSKGERMPEAESNRIIAIHDEIDQDLDILKTNFKSYDEIFTREFYHRCKKYNVASEDRLKLYLLWLYKINCSFQGCNTLSEVSALRLRDYKTCSGDSLINWKTNGYKSILDLFLKNKSDIKEKYPTVNYIQLEKPVKCIEYKCGNDVLVTTNDNTKHVASHVIFTPSVGVLKEQHFSLFKPMLPERKRRAIENSGIGTVNKLYLEFPNQWWPSDSHILCLLWTKEDEEEFISIYGNNYKWLCDVFCFMCLPHQPRVLCGWISGSMARYPESLTDNNVTKQLYILLQRFFGNIYTIPEPIDILRTKWFSDPCFRGSYSFQTTSAERTGVTLKDLAEPVYNDYGKPVLLFAGEATHDYYYSTVHGAIESGFREADRIINYYKIRSRLKGTMERMSELSLEESTKLVIVGAGIAGLAVAKTLEKEGFQDYILLEAQNKAGGRINSIRHDSSFVELGAQFLHGDQSDLAGYCRERNLLCDEQSTEGEGFFIRDDGIEIDSRLIKEVKDIVEYSLAECEGYATNDIISHTDIEPNIGKLLKARFSKYLKMKDYDEEIEKTLEDIFDWHVRFLMIDNACMKLDELSVKKWGNFQITGGPEYNFFKEGYSSLIKYLLSDISTKNVKLNSPVESINYDTNLSSCTTTLFNGTKIHSKCVIVTCSLGYLKEHYKHLFRPLLPSNLTFAIENLGFGVINKIFLEFEVPWWESEAKGFQLIWRQEVLETNLPNWTRYLTGFDVMTGQKAMLLGWIGGEGAYLVEDINEDQITKDCYQLLQRFLKKKDIPKIKSCIRTKWFSNKFALGSYSHITMKCDETNVAPEDLLEPVWSCPTNKRKIPLIMLAGEAASKHYYSTTHGAYDTGVHQAKMFLTHH